MHMIRFGLVVLLIGGCSALVNGRLDDSDGGAGVDAGPGEDSGPTMDGATPDIPAADAGPSVDGGGLDAPPPADAGPDSGPPPITCVGMVDGTPCGDDGICLAEACVTSTCGDVYVDTDRGEECDDGNMIDGDGCDSCAFSCDSHADCDDERFCNGAETCGADHICAPGDVPDDGASCTGEGGSMGVCSDEICVPAGCGNDVVEGMEECDDGNNINGDGCEADCTFECTSNGECDDGVFCNGAESCNALNICVGGSPPPPMPDRCGNGVDDDCDGDIDETNPICYPDIDGDSFHGGTGVPATGCTCDMGFSETNDDCNDNEPSANPGQRIPQPSPMNCTGQPDCMPFDYNCDGVIQSETSTGICTNSLGMCSLGREGWASPMMRPPPCGQPGMWLTNCTGTPIPMCTLQTDIRIQHCL